jgi:hypothetical protein
VDAPPPGIAGRSPTEALVNAAGFGVLLASLFVLRFGAWRRPATVVVYFAFFTSLEWAAAHFFLPPDALPSALGWLCLALAVPVLAAAWLVRRLERGEPADETDRE